MKQNEFEERSIDSPVASGWIYSTLELGCR